MIVVCRRCGRLRDEGWVRSGLVKLARTDPARAAGLRRRLCQCPVNFESEIHGTGRMNRSASQGRKPRAFREGWI